MVSLYRRRRWPRVLLRKRPNNPSRKYTSARITLTDITLGVEAAPDYMSQTNAEAFTIEPIPEMEASSFEDIELPGEANLSEEIEELYSDEETPAPAHETESLDEEISERTVKPSEPVSLHPEEIPMSLDDSFFVE